MNKIAHFLTFLIFAVPAIAQTVQGSTIIKGTLTVTAAKSTSGYWCLQIDSSGNITNTGAVCGGPLTGMTQYGLGVAATASTMTSSVQPSSWTTGHTFVPVWQPSGSALAPTTVDANTLAVSSASTATTAEGLDGIPFTNTPSPALGDVVCYDGVQYTPCPPSAGSAQILYLTNTASDISTYDLWDTVPLGTQFTVAATIPATNVKTLIKAFATTSGYPNITVIPAGEWQADTYAQISSAANTTTMQIDIYNYPVGGPLPALPLFSFADVSITTANLTHYTVEAVEPAFSIGATDRLVVMYSMTHNAGSSITGTVYGGGSTNYSHVHTPIGTTSGNITGLTAGRLGIARSPTSINSSISLYDCKHGLDYR